MEHPDPAPSRSPAERRFVERYGGLARLHGLPSTVGQVFALLLLSPTPLTAEELAERLGVSRSSAHGSARRLQRLGVLERRVESGERATRFCIRSGGLASLMEDTLHQLREGRELAAETLREWEAGDPVVRLRLESLHRLQGSAIAAIEEVVRQHRAPRPSGSGKAAPEPLARTDHEASSKRTEGNP